MANGHGWCDICSRPGAGMFSSLIGLHYAEAGWPVMKSETRWVPDPLMVKRRQIEGNLFIRASSLGQSANETFTGAQILHCYQTSSSSGFILFFPDDSLSGKRWFVFYHQNLPRSQLTNPPLINPKTFLMRLSFMGYSKINQPIWR